MSKLTLVYGERADAGAHTCDPTGVTATAAAPKAADLEDDPPDDREPHGGNEQREEPGGDERRTPRRVGQR